MVEYNNDNKGRHRYGTYTAGGFTKGAYSDACGANDMGRYYATRAKRVDLLGYIRQKSGDERYPYREGTLENERRHAQAVLLGRLYTSLKTMPYMFL